MSDEPVIYLDHNATTPADPRVLEAMWPHFRERAANASSRQHAPGRAARDAVETAREQVAALIGAGSRELCFTSGATESNNFALKGATGWLADHAPGKTHIVTASTEHPSVREPVRRLEQRGWRVTWIDPAADGILRAEQVERAITGRTALVSIMWANNETGVVNDVERIGHVCKQRGVWFHCDATQAVGKVPVSVERAGADLLSCSAHKLYGPKGVGALYRRSTSPRPRLAAQIDGGGHERGLRSGTPNVPGIVGFGVAARLCSAMMDEEARRLAGLRDRLERGLAERVRGVAINGDPSRRLPHVSNVSFPGRDADALLEAMPAVAASSAAACTGEGATAGSIVLRRMGLGEDRARGSIRFALGRDNTASEIDRAIEHVIAAVERTAPVGAEDGCELM